MRRRFAPSPEFPVVVDWAALPSADPVLTNLDRLLRGVRAIVDEVCADELGRAAWAGIRTVRVAHRSDFGAQPSVEPAPDGLVVLADLTVALPRNPDRRTAPAVQRGVVGGSDGSGRASGDRAVQER
ncbi:MAG TPA: hypothetical protein VF892_12520 [Pseudonocardiaceae bacterium]